jgi:hypothetical protein
MSCSAMILCRQKDWQDTQTSVRWCMGRVTLGRLVLKCVLVLQAMRTEFSLFIIVLTLVAQSTEVKI